MADAPGQSSIGLVGHRGMLLDAITSVQAYKTVDAFAWGSYAWFVSES
jgi:hypothetical protein